MKVQVLQHVAFETPGLLSRLILEKGHSMETTGLYNDDVLPATGDFDALIVMGGPMSVHDEAEYPWLVGEKALIGAAIREGKKVLGICLGAQLVAEVCGGNVRRAEQKEIGWWPVRFPNGSSTVVFHWHGETVDLPPAAELLASTDVCVNQAFRIGDRVLGIQFHPEVTDEIIREMIGHEGWELAEAGPFIQGADRILEGVREFGGQGLTGQGLDWQGLTGQGLAGQPWLGRIADWLGV
jgi:GMP synthase-like glutamine amidotransferase